MMPRTYRIAYMVCGLLMLGSAVLGPIVAIRVLNSSDASRQRASDRITGLQNQITRLNQELDQSAADRASLHTAVDSLSAQIRLSGGTPVANPASQPTTTTTPTTRPVPTTTTTRACRVVVFGICVP